MQYLEYFTIDDNNTTVAVTAVTLLVLPSDMDDENNVDKQKIDSWILSSTKNATFVMGLLIPVLVT